MAMICKCATSEGKDAPGSRAGGCLHFIPEKKAYLLFGGERSSLVQTPSSANMPSSGTTRAPKNDKVYFYDNGIVGSIG